MTITIRGLGYIRYIMYIVVAVIPGFIHTMIALRPHRKLMKVSMKDIKLHPKTIRSIDNGNGTASIRALETYLESIGMQLTISIVK